MWRWKDLPYNLACIGGLVAAVELVSYSPAAGGLLGLLSLTLLVGFYVYRRLFHQRIAYITGHGIRVILGGENHPTKEMVEDWTRHVIRLVWLSSRSPYNEKWSNEKILGILKTLWVEFNDTHLPKITWKSAGGPWWIRYIRGYDWDHYVKVSSPHNWYNADISWTYVRDLFYHELAHPLLYLQDPRYYRESEAHERMDQIGVR